MSCLALKIVKAYSVVTTLFRVEQYFYTVSDNIIATSFEYQTPMNDYRVTFFGNNKENKENDEYKNCFYPDGHRFSNELTVEKDLTVNSYLIKDPSIVFNLNRMKSSFSAIPFYASASSPSSSSPSQSSLPSSRSKVKISNKKSEHNNEKSNEKSNEKGKMNNKREEEKRNKKNSVLHIRSNVFNDTKYEECKKKHLDYFDRNWFTKLFYLNPCTTYSHTEVVDLNLDQEKCIIGTIDKYWETTVYPISHTVSKTKIKHCTGLCHSKKFVYVGVENDKLACKCSMQPPSSVIEINSSLCEKCSDEDDKSKNNCGNSKYGFFSVYRISS